MSNNRSISHHQGSLVLSFALIIFLTLIVNDDASAQTLKKSSSGICHPLESRYFNSTTNFQPFDTLQECLESGGRLPKNLARESSAPGKQSAYDRAKFGTGWSDSDRDCQDSRAEALIAASTTNVTFADPEKCRVITGRWISLYTGQIIQNSSQIDIDHIVPLKWAWSRGASNWTSQNRALFANDSINLIPVEASLNRSKGSRGPDEWLPPTSQCQYIARFMRIVRLYKLEPSIQELSDLNKMLVSCGKN